MRIKVDKITLPNYETFRRLLKRLDLGAFAQVLSAWLGEHRGALSSHLAIDGKTIRSTLGTIVTLCDTDEKAPDWAVENNIQLRPMR